MKKVKKEIKDKIFKKFFTEYQIKNENNYTDFTRDELDIIGKVKGFTMTSAERVVSLIRAVNYIELNNIGGSIIECGVWKGGSIMAALLALKEKNRDVYLYDTFEGMSEPTDQDKSYKDESAKKAYINKDEYWKRIECFSTLDEVKNNIYSIDYPKNKIKFIQGKVEDTIPNIIPEKIAILRLDTDWYESTMHEMIHLFPRLVAGGVIIIDDYGHWKGCRKAIDEYINDNNVKLLLNRIDYTGRIGIKL
ncbi:TylF/MycF/NovP-related O-methyltransferase [uncultured Winogradskyella sp.]|uniref:TylF/MycF/NovP-related O-methyltransferase n=1 Tax=uncultured Winogradskyella sp. TaxID=395353 RepID=UPI0026210085|nr:TylF/MycF/NovP-related O-methyltransferase [uncultured Winogradskyella sp.]